MRLLYNFGIVLLAIFIRLAAPFVPKAKKWVAGRRGWRTSYPEIWRARPNGRTLWMHVSSLGEFEQGRPVIEQFRIDFPDWRIVLTFFSPSGYEIRKNYPLVDAVLYLPADTPRNARDFIDMVQPDAVIFVKYDFWANYLFQLKKRGAPTLLVSALFRPSQPFFKWYGGLWRDMVNCFTHIFVQNDASAILLQNIGFQNVTVAGDTRVDRVLRIAAEAPANDMVAAFVAEAPVLVIGSSWEADEQVYMPALQHAAFQRYKIIIAPHEPSERHVTRICSVTGNAVRYSDWSATPHGEYRVLVIDNIGLLNTLYRYGTLAYIGGGFGKGIHNTLEPAAFGLPILFGPNFGKFEEARQFVSRGGAFPVTGTMACVGILQQLEEPAAYKKASEAVLQYLEKNKGATLLAIAWLQAHFMQQYASTTKHRPGQ